MTSRNINASRMAHSRMLAELRDSISEGRLQPGDRLPPEKDLAKMFDISVTSVRRGINVLVDEGAVERRQGSGTYVLQQRQAPAPTARRDTVAMIISIELTVYHPFFSEEFRGFRDGIRDLGWRMVDLDSPRSLKQENDIVFFPVDAAQVAGWIGKHPELTGALVAANVAPDLIKRINNSIPVVAPDSTEACPYASYDFERELARAIDHLRLKGARKIWICDGGDGSLVVPRLERGNEDTKIPALIWDNTGHSAHASDVTANAHRLALKALKTHTGIDGIVVGSDFAAQGVADALTKRKIRVPHDVRVAAIVNSESRLHIPFPTTKLIADGRAQGLALARLLHEHIVSPRTAPSRVELACTLESDG